MQIGSSTYSFKRLNHQSPEEAGTTLLDMIELAPDYGVAGLEVLGVHLESQERRYLHKLKRRALLNGVDLYALALHHSFVTPDEEKRKEQVDIVLRGLEMAEEMGIPSMRVFGGRWGTVPDFKELMDREGLEEPLPGYTYEDALRWNVEAFTLCAERAGEKGIMLSLENHWGLTRNAEGVLDILNGVNSPWLQVALDCGNFRENTYEQLEQLVPHTAVVHAKSYHGGGIFYDLDIDYERILRMLKDTGFRGWLSIEFEGKASPSTGIPATVKLLEEAVRRA